MSNLELKDWQVGYGNCSILSNLNLSVAQGQLYYLLGKNGSGKSSLIKSILHIYPPLNGQLWLNGKDYSENSRALSTEVAYVKSETGALPKMSVYEVLSFGRIPYHRYYPRLSKQERTLIQESAETLGIEKMLNWDVRKLSDGQRQMVMIARALVQETPFILLDEPCSHLDFQNTLKINQLLKKLTREQNKGIVVSSHHWEEAIDFADELWCIQGDQLICGFPEDAIQALDFLDELFTSNTVVLTQTIHSGENKSKRIFKIEGLPKRVFWMTRALLRAGYKVETGANETIFCNTKTYKYRDLEFPGIREVLNFIKLND